MGLAYHLMNIVKVKSPRWHDRVILPRLDKFKPGYNLMTIDHHNYPSKYLMHTKRLQQYPVETIHSKQWGDYKVAVIPLADLETPQEHELANKEIVETIRKLWPD